MTAASRAFSEEKARRYKFARLIVGFDGSRTSRFATMWAREIAAIDRASVTIASVAPHVTRFAMPFDSAGAIALQRGIEGVACQFERRHLPVDRLTPRGDAADEIIRAERKDHADLILLGSRGRGALRSLALGSTTDRVKDHAHASVLLAKTPPPARRIVAPTDGSSISTDGVRAAAALGRAWDVPVDVLQVRAKPSGRRGSLRFGSPRLAGYSLESVSAYGDPAEGILAHAKDTNAGLIVMSHRALGALASLALGSVSAKIAHESPIAVLFVKPRRSP